MQYTYFLSMQMWIPEKQQMATTISLSKPLTHNRCYLQYWNISVRMRKVFKGLVDLSRVQIVRE